MTVAAADLDRDTRAALRRHILTLADTKRILGIRYSDWLLGAPSIETGIAASSMAQDEWGHARLLYAMLKELGEDPVPVEHDRPADAYASMDGLDDTPGDWAGVVALIVVVDGALTSALEGFAGGGWEQAGSRVPKMVAEEAFHRDLGHAWFRRLADGSDEARERLVGAAAALLPRTAAWLAPEDEAFGRLVAAGLAGPGDEALQRWQADVDAVLGEVSLAASKAFPRREGWDEARGRGPGRPDDEAVERARGDRNRDLFVE